MRKSELGTNKEMTGCVEGKREETKKGKTIEKSVDPKSRKECQGKNGEQEKKGNRHGSSFLLAIDSHVKNVMGQTQARPH
jgi:hypothetical protein